MRAGEAGRPFGRAARVAAVFALAGAIVIAAGAPAFADPVPPPGWQGAAPGSWVTFELSTYTPAPGAAISLNRGTNLADDALLAAFDNWAAPQTPDGPVGWPESFSASGVTLTRSAWCDYSEPSCAYTLASGDGSEFWVAVATDDPPGSGQYPIDLATTPHGTVDVQDPPPPPPTDPVVVANVSFASGTATFDASGSEGPNGSTPAGYRWTLVGGQQGTQEFTCDAPVCSPPANITLDPGATYDVTLDLLDASGTSMASSPGVAQLPVPDAPPPAGGGGGGGTPNNPPANPVNPANPANPANARIIFANPERREPSSLGGGGGSGAATAPTIVWLWRPEWFQPTIGAELPKTSGRPEVKGSAEIVVSAAGPDGASAGPWLVGLGAFGLLGGGYLFNRSRRVRLLEI